MRVLSVASECFPYVKTGGLADVVGALPSALKFHGVHVETALPHYPNLEPSPGLHLIEIPWAFDRPGSPYLDEQGKAWPDNVERFLAFARGAARLAYRGGFDLVHAHDWQAAAMVAFLDQIAAMEGRKRIPCVLTVHNLAFQGGTDFLEYGSTRRRDTGLENVYFGSDWFEFYGHHNLLKGGLLRADAVTTVSPTYAREIQTPEEGFGLDPILSYRASQGALHGILNGLDLQQWNPAEDPSLVQPYGAARVKSGKAAQKNRTQIDLGLNVDPARPMMGLVSRLSDQKGIDLLIAASATWLSKGGQLVALGSGDADLEGQLRQLADANPTQVSFTQGYSETLSHQIHAASDFLAVPSRFEPCGLTQLSAQRYASLPIVTPVGGLADTVTHLEDGFVTQDVSVASLSVAFGQALSAYTAYTKFAKMRQNAIKKDLGWQHAAQAYADLYQALLDS